MIMKSKRPKEMAEEPSGVLKEPKEGLVNARIFLLLALVLSR
jgi:hypothetical protein